MPLGAGTAAGATSGASAGMAFGPWGALAGAVIGGILGSLGPSGPKTRPWIDIPMGADERVANRLDKDTWKSLIARYQGGPQNVLSSYSAMKTAYPTADAMSVGPDGGRYTPARATAQAAQQDTTAKAVNAETGWNLHKWAMGGKLASGGARSGYNNAISQMQMANQVHNAALQGQWDAQQRALWAQAGMSAMNLAGGLYGAYGGGGGSTSTSTMAGLNSSGGVTAPASPYAGFNSAGQVTPSPYSWQNLVGQSVQQPAFHW